MSSVPAAVLATWLQHGLTAKGTALLSFEEMVALGEFAARAGLMVHTVEGYVLTGGAEICTPEFSLYGPEDRNSETPWADQILRALQDVHLLAVKSDRDGVVVRFQVWLQSA